MSSESKLIKDFKKKQQFSNMIKIYNPQEKPFGHLSNNWYYPMKINSKVYPTVTNYILSNLVTTPLYQIILQSAKIFASNKNSNFHAKVDRLVKKIEQNQSKSLTFDEKENLAAHVKYELDVEKQDIYSLYNTYLRLEYIQTVRSAVEEAYNKRFMDNDLVQLLLSTGNRPIVYISQNNILGVNNEGYGANLIGRILTQIRFNLKKQKKQYEEQKKEEKINNKIFNTYIASQILQHQINKGKNIDRYIRKSASEIIDMFKQGKDMEYVLNMLQIDPNVKLDVVAHYKKGGMKELHEEIQNPGSLSILVVKKMTKENLVKTRDIVFKSFVLYYAKKKKKSLSDSQLEKAFMQLKFQTTDQEYIEYKEKIYDIYLSDDLPSDLMETIKDKTENLKVFSDDEIVELEDIEPSESREQDIEIIEDGASSSDSNNSDSSDSDSDNSIKKNFLSDDKKERLSLLEKIKNQTGLAINLFKNKTTEQLRKMLGKDKPEKNKLYNRAKKKYITVSRDKIEKLVSKLEEYKRKGVTEFKTTKGIVTIQDISKTYSEALDKIGKRASVWVITQQSNKQSNRQSNDENAKIVEYESDDEDTKVWMPDPGMEDVEQLIGHKTLGEPVNIYANPLENKNGYEVLSPLYNEAIEINGVSFPNIAMVITARLFQKTGVSKNNNQVYKGMSIKKVLTYIKPNDNFVSNEEADRIYMSVNKQAHFELEKYFLKVALDEKYKSLDLQELLLMTGDMTIVWADPNDMLLGAGTKTQVGQNLVGKMLMEMRTQIKRAFTGYKIIDSSMLGKAIEEDKFLSDWIEMRLNDMCSVVAKLKQYLEYMTNIDEDIDTKFVKTVINNFYPSCTCLRNLNKEVNPYPKIFLNLVLACPNMQLTLEKTHSVEVYDDNKESKQELRDAREMLDHYKRQLDEIDIGDVSSDTKNMRNILKGNISKMKILIQQQSGDYKKRVMKVAQVYWNWISSILSTVIYAGQAKNKSGNRTITTLNMKKVLAKAELSLSKETDCVRILDNRQDNCIASALINVLISIGKFKYQYAENIPLGEDDIRLAASIILNRDLREVPVEYMAESKKDIDDNKYEEYNVAIDDSGLYDSDSDDEEEVELIQGNEEKIEFSFGDKDKVNDIKAHLQGINNNIKEPEKVASFFLGMVVVIKTFPMVKKLKSNRINFFATIE